MSLVLKIKGFIRPSDLLLKSFKETFNANLMVFWCVYTGFNIVAFDEWMKTPDEVSLSDYVASIHGEDARALILSVIRAEPEF